MHGPKPHKGLLKRIRVTKNGKVKMRRAYGRHLRSHKSGNQLRKYRKPLIISETELQSIGELLHRRLRGRAKAPATARSDAAAPADRKPAAGKKTSTRKASTRRKSASASA